MKAAHPRAHTAVLISLSVAGFAFLFCIFIAPLGLLPAVCALAVSLGALVFFLLRRRGKTGGGGAVRRSRVVFCCTAAAGALLVRFFDPDVGFTVLYVLAVFFLVSLISILSAARSIRVEQTMDRDILFKGEQLQYRARIVNRGLFYFPRAEIHWHDVDTVSYGGIPAAVTALYPRRTSVREYTIAFPYRGRYRVGIERVTVTDLFGLFSRTFAPREPLDALVYPKSDDDFFLVLASDTQLSAIHGEPFNEDYTAVADVRKYEQGDSMKKVHWKLSARRGELMVKNFQQYIRGETCILIDTKAPPLEGGARARFEDRMVSCAAAAVDACAQSRLPVQIRHGECFALGERIDPADDLDKPYIRLAEVAFTQRDTSFRGYEPDTAQDADRNLLLFLYDLDGECCEAVRDLVPYAHRVALYIFHSPAALLTQEKEGYLDRLRAHGVAVSAVAVEE